MIDEVRGRYSWERRLLDSNLDTSAKCLGLAIATYTSRSQPTAWPSTETLADDISRTVRTVQRLLNDLVEAGFIEKEDRYSDGGRQLSTMYVLTVPRDMGDAGVVEIAGDTADLGDTSVASPQKPGEEGGEGDTHDTPGGDTHVTLTDQRNRTTDSILRSAPNRIANPTPAQALVGWWVDKQALAPSRSDIGKQAGVAKRMLDRYGIDAVRVAVAGMGHLYPYSEGQPWDLFDLERKFLKAAEALFTSNPKARASRDRARILDRIRQS